MAKYGVGVEFTATAARAQQQHEHRGVYSWLVVLVYGVRVTRPVQAVKIILDLALSCATL